VENGDICMIFNFDFEIIAVYSQVIHIYPAIRA